MPVLQQFLAVLCFYGVVMVKPESSEDGASAKELEKELLTSQGGEELGKIRNCCTAAPVPLGQESHPSPNCFSTNCSQLYRLNEYRPEETCLETAQIIKHHPR